MDFGFRVQRLRSRPSFWLVIGLRVFDAELRALGLDHPHIHGIYSLAVSYCVGTPFEINARFSTTQAQPRNNQRKTNSVPLKSARGTLPVKGSS